MRVRVRVRVRADSGKGAGMCGRSRRMAGSNSTIRSSPPWSRTTSLRRSAFTPAYAWPIRTQCGQGCARRHRANAADGCGRRIAVPLQDAVPVVVPLLRAVCRVPGSVRWKMRVCQEEEEEAPASSSWTSMSSWWGRKRSNTFAPRLKDSVWRSAYMLMCAAPRRPIVSVRIRLYDVRDCAQHARTGGTPEHCRHCTAGTARSTRRTAGLSRMT